MAQLFQPTNITPDTRGAFGNGIILKSTGSTSYVTVSWQINGNVPMVAFSIDFTDMNGNQLYSTGKIVLDFPAYGVSANGETALFSYKIGPLSNSGSLLSQTEGLMKITQWWGSGENDYITQTSSSHFVVRVKPTVSITQTSDSTTRIASFSGSISGAETDGIMWIRWVLTSQDDLDTNHIIKDTGRLYGAVEPTFTYDGFLPGTYTLTLSTETSIGVQASGSITAMISYDVADAGPGISVAEDCNSKSALSIRWPRLQSIPVSENTGDVTDDGDYIILPSEESKLVWNEVNSSAMKFNRPWSVVWSGKITSAFGGKLFTLKTTNGYWEAGVAVNNGKGRIYVNIVRSGTTTRLVYHDVEWEKGTFVCCVTPTQVFWRCEADSGTALYPSETLFPKNNLYPGRLSGTSTVFLNRNIPSAVTQTPITKVTLHGPSYVKYFEIFSYAMSENNATEYLTGEKVGSYDENAYFFLKSLGTEQNYNAGNWPDELRSGTIISVYRKTRKSTNLEFVGSSSIGSGNEILDYAARSQQGPYTYYLYVLSSDKYINVPSISGAINPCFWDWTVLSCKENTDGSFAVESSYRFGKNLQSGSISNGNQPGIFQNFTPYPTVMISPQNYQGGTLQSLIGIIENENYSDTIDLRNAIYALSTTTNALFLKNRKGDLLRIRPSGAIAMETMDSTRAQAQTVSFPWVEVGNASNVAIYSLGDE